MRDALRARRVSRLGVALACVAIVALESACNEPDADADSDADVDADTDADADVGGDGDADADIDADAGTDADADADADEGERIGKSGRRGSGVTTAGGYSGTEEMYFIADEGAGETLCRITYRLESTGAPLDDCDDCAWAYELVRREAAVAEERDPGCEATLGIAAANVGELDGTSVFYGYAPDYMGHANVLMSRLDASKWAPECFATWNEASGAFTYERIDGYPPY